MSMILEVRGAGNSVGNLLQMITDVQATTQMLSTVTGEKMPIIGAKFVENPHISGEWGHFEEAWPFGNPSKGTISKKVPITGAGIFRKVPIIGANFFKNPATIKHILPCTKILLDKTLCCFYAYVM